jgi:hypothetical protein
MIKLPFGTKLRNPRNFFFKNRNFIGSAVKISFRKVAIIAIGVLGLNNGCSFSRRSLAWKQFCCADKLGIPSAIRPFDETLHRNTNQPLTQNDDKPFKLIVIQIFVGVFHSRELFYPKKASKIYSFDLLPFAALHTA